MRTSVRSVDGRPSSGCSWSKFVAGATSFHAGSDATSPSSTGTRSTRFAAIEGWANAMAGTRRQARACAAATRRVTRRESYIRRSPLHDVASLVHSIAIVPAITIDAVPVPADSKHAGQDHAWNDGVARLAEAYPDRDGTNHGAGEERDPRPERARYEDEQRAGNLQRAGQVAKPLSEADPGEERGPHRARVELVPSD